MAESIVSIFLIVLFGPVILTTLYGFVTEAPLVYSPRRALEQALKLVEAKPGEKFYDLGAGSGRTMIIAHKKFGLNVSGFEISPFIYFLAKINLAANGIDRSAMHCHNFHNQSLAEADIIFCFLSPSSMKKLRTKFERELKRGARIISYAFRVHGWPEHAILESGHPGKTYIYVKK